MMEGKLSGYVAQLNYRFMNLCVKAEPMSLLSARFNIQGEEKSIEDVAMVSKKGDYYYLASDGTPLCDNGENPTLALAAQFINQPAHQDIKYLLESEVEKNKK